MNTEKDIDRSIKQLRNIGLAVIFIIIFWLYKMATGPPYEVKLKHGNVVNVHMQSTLNRYSAEIIELPRDVKCVRTDGRTYGEVQQYYHLFCEGRTGYVRTFQVILP